LITLEGAEAQFYREEQTQGIAADIHGPNGPGLSGAKSPWAEDHHDINQRLAGIFADAIELHVCGAQTARAAHAVSPFLALLGWDRRLADVHSG
jgi:hypothetical protein